MRLNPALLTVALVVLLPPATLADAQCTLVPSGNFAGWAGDGFDGGELEAIDAADAQAQCCQRCLETPPCAKWNLFTMDVRRKLQSTRQLQDWAYYKCDLHTAAAQLNPERDAFSAGSLVQASPPPSPRPPSPKPPSPRPPSPKPPSPRPPSPRPPSPRPPNRKPPSPRPPSPKPPPRRPNCRGILYNTPFGQKCAPGFYQCAPKQGPVWFACPSGLVWNGKPGRAGTCDLKKRVGCK